MQKHVNLVDFVKSFQTNIYLRNLASIQARTSPNTDTGHHRYAYPLFSAQLKCSFIGVRRYPAGRTATRNTSTAKSRARIILHVIAPLCQAGEFVSTGGEPLGRGKGRQEGAGNIVASQNSVGDHRANPSDRGRVARRCT